MNISLAYILIVPLMLYIGIMREQVSDSIYKVFGIFGLANFLINAYWLYSYRKVENNHWLYYINLFLVSPVIIIIGVNGKYTKSKYFEMLLMISFALFGYQLLSVIREIISR